MKILNLCALVFISIELGKEIQKQKTFKTLMNFVNSVNEIPDEKENPKKEENYVKQRLFFA